MKRFMVVLLAIAAAIFCSGEFARAQETFLAPVTQITDGDTVRVMRADGEEEIRIRFGGIDTPERSQRYGAEATDALASLVEGKTVRVELTDNSSGSRRIGAIFVPATETEPEIDVSLELVRGGHAWWFWQFAADNPDRARLLATAETEAKIARRGIFAIDDPIYPRIFRRGARVPNEFLPEILADRVAMIALVPNPIGRDDGEESIAIGNGTSSLVSLENWSVRDANDGFLPLSGEVGPQRRRVFTIGDPNVLRLANNGDAIFLHDANGDRVQTLTYDSADPGEVILP